MLDNPCWRALLGGQRFWRTVPSLCSSTPTATLRGRPRRTGCDQGWVNQVNVGAGPRLTTRLARYEGSAMATASSFSFSPSYLFEGWPRNAVKALLPPPLLLRPALCVQRQWNWSLAWGHGECIAVGCALAGRGLSRQSANAAGRHEVQAAASTLISLFSLYVAQPRLPEAGGLWRATPLWHVFKDWPVLMFRAQVVHGHFSAGGAMCLCAHDLPLKTM